MKNTHALRGYLCTILGGLSWGFSGVCGQYLFAELQVDSLWLVCIRILCSGALLSLLALWKTPRQMREIWRQPRDVAQLVCYGIFGLLLCQYAYLTAIFHSNAATATVLQTLNLVFIMLASCLRRRCLPRRLEVLALCLGLFGTFILATGGDPGQMRLSTPGLFWGIANAAAGVAYTMLPEGLLKRWDSFVVLGYGMLIGGIFINLAAGSWNTSVQLPPSGWLAVAVIILFGTLLPFALVTQGLIDIGPIKTAMLATVEPVAATVISALWLGTEFTGTDLIGFAAILAIVFLLAKPK